MDERLRRSLEDVFGGVEGSRPVGGGCIHSALAVRFDDGMERFVKWSTTAPQDMFPAEAAGLRALEDGAAAEGPEDAAVLRIPGNAEAHDGDGIRWIAMEMIEEGRPGPGFFESFGRALAGLHRNARSDRHGFEQDGVRDNYIGATPQPNPWTEDGVDFVRRHRLGHQLRLARDAGRSDAELDRLGDRLLDRLGDWLGPGFDEHDAAPSLLHGDLWSGNFLCDAEGRPVIVDPAAYYGHREADLAMTRLFGGFGSAFYRAYEEAWPLPPGSDERIAIHQLYHLLNHLNLFGRSYRGRCVGILRRLVG